MKRPKLEDYSLNKGVNIQSYISDLNKFIDQEKAEKKKLIEYKEFMTSQLEKGGLMFLIQRDKDAYLKLVKSIN